MSVICWFGCYCLCDVILFLKTEKRLFYLVNRRAEDFVLHILYSRLFFWGQYLLSVIYLFVWCCLLCIPERRKGLFCLVNRRKKIFTYYTQDCWVVIYKFWWMWFAEWMNFNWMNVVPNIILLLWFWILIEFLMIWIYMNF